VEPDGAAVTEAVRVIAGARATAAVMAAAVVAAVIPSVLPIFGGGGAGWMAAAVVIPVLIGLLSVGVGARLPAIDRVSFRLATEAAAVLVILAFLPASPHGQSALGGLANGAAQLVTSVLPAPASGSELGFVVVAIAVAAAAAVELAVGGRRPLLSLLPPALLYLAALLLGAGGRPAPKWGALALMATAGVFLLASSPRQRDRPASPPTPGAPTIAGARPDGPRPAYGRLVAGGLVLVAVVALAVPVGAVLPGAGKQMPYNLRAAISAPPQPLDQVSLLAAYASIYDGPVRQMFTVSTQGADPASLYWRLDIYDQFQGTQWTSSAVFQRAGVQLPAGPRLAVTTTPVTAEVTLLTPTGYLPAPARPVAVSVGGLDVSESDDLLAVPAGTAVPPRYVVRADVATPDRSQLLAGRAATVPSDQGSASLPPGVTSIAAALIARAGPDALSRLANITSYLTGPGFALHPPGDSPIGSGSYQVVQLLDVTHVGSSEQFAAAFALLARAMGFQTRLAVGYVGGHRGPANGQVTYTTRDLTVWPEVDLEGIGWLAFPADPSSAGRPAAPSAALSSPLGQALHQQQQINAAGTGHSPTPGQGLVTRPGPRGGGVTVLMVAAWVVLLIGAGLVSVLGAKALRKRRQRRQPSPVGRVNGAWDHVLDRLAELGVGVPPSFTGPEVVGRAGARLGSSCASPIAALAGLVDATHYDRRYPPRTEVAATAWAHAGELDAVLRRSVSFRRRAGASLSLAPWRRSRRRSPVRVG
jgi:transglutaminase-like putative cysteine protease